jgi:hypothetical protein
MEAMQYTIQVEADDGYNEPRVIERRNITDNRSARELVVWTAHHNAAVGDGNAYEARIWLGYDADPDTEPVATARESRSEDAPD